MKPFHRLLLNNLIANATNNFLWFALTFWVYLETRSVIASSVVGAFYPLLMAASGLFFGTYVDHHKKKTAMMLSSFISFGLFLGALGVFQLFGQENILNIGKPFFWVFVLLVMSGAVAGNLRMITLATLVTLLVPEKNRDKANGLVGMVNGVSFAITSVFSGLAVAYLGMGGSLVIGCLSTLVVLAHLHILKFKDTEKSLNPEPAKKIDFSGSLQAVKAVPGLFGLIFFTMINNFLGGAFFALMDPYGLELVSVQTWGFIWGGLSLAFIFGGMIVAKYGLGKHPLHRLFMANTCMWIIGLIFPIQASIFLVVAGMFGYLLLIPTVEAAEHTILQKVVPLAKQGRVFGFAQTMESLASPVMALMIGPIAHAFFIPFMTTGRGVDLIGGWFGTGVNRGIGLVFIFASAIGLIITRIALRSRTYTLVSNDYSRAK